MCLVIHEEETKRIKKTHPRFLKWWKHLVIFKGKVVSPSFNYSKWAPGWTVAKGKLGRFNRFIVNGGAIHVYESKHEFSPEWHIVVPVYGRRRDFIAVGGNIGFTTEACYKKVYMPKVAWQKIVKPALLNFRDLDSGYSTMNWTRK